MMTTPSAQAALEALWQVMLEIAESTNDEIVQRQSSTTAADANAINDACSDLAQFAQTAASLARRAANP